MSTDETGRSELDLRRSLNALSTAPVDVGGDRLGAIELRILDTIGQREDGGGDGIGGDDEGVGDDEHRRRLLPAIVPKRRASLRGGLVAACVIVLVVVALSVVSSGNESLVIAAADDVTIVLSDGTEVDGEAGVELPDGARLDVDGFVDVGSTRYGPGSYVVDDGELVVAAVDDQRPANQDGGLDVEPGDQPIRPDPVATEPLEVVRATTTPAPRPSPTSTAPVVVPDERVADEPDDVDRTVDSVARPRPTNVVRPEPTQVRDIPAPAPTTTVVRSTAPDRRDTGTVRTGPTRSPATTTTSPTSTTSTTTSTVPSRPTTTVGRRGTR